MFSHLFLSKQDLFPTGFKICRIGPLGPPNLGDIDDVRGKRRYSRNILQWSKNDIKSKKSTNGDYYGRVNEHLCSISINFEACAKDLYKRIAFSV